MELKTEMQEITRKKFDYYLNVLPPLIMGKEAVLCFLEHFDLNANLIKEINKIGFIDLFMQGEGWDKHNIYGCTKDKYFLIGTTLKEWETENFRYGDTGNDMLKKIHDRLNKITPLNNEVV